MSRLPHKTSDSLWRCKMALADIVHRIATDAAFAAHIKQDPAATLAAAGLTLDEKEIAAVLAVLHGKARWEDLCSSSRIAPEGTSWGDPLFSPRPILSNPSSPG